MGASNVAKAFEWAPHLTDVAFRVLMVMAVTALDTGTEAQAAGEYFAGPKPLEAVLRGPDQSTASRAREARRGVQELVAVGAIRAAWVAHRGKRQKYLLTLDGPKLVGAFTPRKRGKGGDSAPTKEGEGAPTKEGHMSPQGRGTVPPPRNQEEPLQELREEEGVKEDGPVTVRARDADTEPEPISSLPPCGDPTCFLGYVKVPGAKGNQRCPVCNPARTKPAWTP